MKLTQQMWTAEWVKHVQVSAWEGLRESPDTTQARRVLVKNTLESRGVDCSILDGMPHTIQEDPAWKMPLLD